MSSRAREGSRAFFRGSRHASFLRGNPSRGILVLRRAGPNFSLPTPVLLDSNDRFCDSAPQVFETRDHPAGKLVERFGVRIILAG